MRRRGTRTGLGRAMVPLALLLLAVGCQPTVKIEAPDKPITINVNVRVKIEKEADKVIEQKEELF